MAKSIIYFAIAVLCFTSVNTKKKLKFYEEKVCSLILVYFWFSLRRNISDEKKFW